MVHGLVLAEAKTLVREHSGVKNLSTQIKRPRISESTLEWAVRMV